MSWYQAFPAKLASQQKSRAYPAASDDLKKLLTKTDPWKKAEHSYAWNTQASIREHSLQFVLQERTIQLGNQSQSKKSYEKMLENHNSVNSYEDENVRKSGLMKLGLFAALAFGLNFAEIKEVNF
jgi:hypothetical protein